MVTSNVTILHHTDGVDLIETCVALLLFPHIPISLSVSQGPGNFRIQYRMYLLCIVLEIFALYLVQQHSDCSSYRGGNSSTFSH